MYNICIGSCWNDLIHKNTCTLKFVWTFTGVDFSIMVTIGSEILSVSKCWFFYVVFVVKTPVCHNEHNKKWGN